MRALRNRAFSLVELVVAMGIGIFVALAAYAAFRTTAQTIAVVNRLSLENRAMRTGIDQALYETDFWTSMDDPEDPTSQPLRANSQRDTTYAPRVFEGRIFAAFREIPVYRDWDESSPNIPTAYQPVPWKTRPLEPLLDSNSQLRNELRCLDRDSDRGWDSLRPYVASDPRSWYRGNIAERGTSDKRAGRYALLSSKRRFPFLGFGDDPREIGGWCRDARLGSQVITGPYGQISGIPSHFTWRDHQLTFLHQSLGFYGMMDYLPSNTVYATYGAWILGEPPPGGTYYSSSWPNALTQAPLTTVAGGGVYLETDGRLDFRFVNHNFGYEVTKNGSSDPFSYSAAISEPRANGDANNRLDSGPVVSLYQTGRTYPLLPPSRYTGIFNVSFTLDTGGHNDGFLNVRTRPNSGYTFRPGFNYYGTLDDQGTIPNTDLSDTAVLEMNRYSWPGELVQPYYVNILWQRAVQLRPIAKQRPSGWPEMHTSNARMLWRSRFMTLNSVRWTDNQSGEVAELRFATFGTTLRGARQQRHQDQGWAAFNGVTFNLTTGVVTNNPYAVGEPEYSALDKNDPTLDSP